ncbi:methylase [Aquabacterium sp. NJ1]|uniref:methyltransferase n=1 Tax=Aquabacterium sp. NJ1 TaxID=1538295 RepID=UPI00052CFA68|nr:class I SAM-dependent methyltransferase [Aquabacterium sp. NJ1]KGM40582.1 methylase [Aquabacterium sp. NJ1]
MCAAPLHRIHWTGPDGQAASALWRSEAGVAAHQKVVLADDTMPANTAYKLACEGTALLWQGDFQNARHLLQALTRRLEPAAGRAGGKGQGKRPKHQEANSAGQAFNQHRQKLAHRARILGMLLIPFEADHTIPLRRAPDVKQACEEAYGAGTEPYVASLRELLGLIGAHEWRKKGVEVPAIRGRIHAHYGVFSPVRGEYVDLVAKAPLPPGAQLAFDIGTGSGVLAAVLARRGIAQVIATDQDPRALACAHDNLRQLKLDKQVQVIEADLFPPGQAPLIVCNPPWLPARPSSPIEYAVYDPDSRMLRGFLAGLRAHLSPQGEGWLIMSDLAEHLGLRGPDELQGWIKEAGLQIVGKLDARPHHPKTQDASDPLHQARAAEVTSLWRLAAA